MPIRTLGRLALLLTIPTLLAAQTYTVADLGAIFGDSSRARGVNATRQVTGYSANNSGNSIAFRYSNGTMSNLGTLGGTSAIGLAINSSGQVAGYSTLSDGS